MAVSIQMSITQNSQNIANNTSNVTVKVTAHWTYGTYNALVDANGKPQAKGTVTIDGTKYDFAHTFNAGQTTTGSEQIFTKTLNITHGSDGKKTLTCSASYVTGVSSGTVTCSASKALTTIARKSSVTASPGTLTIPLTLSVTRQSSSLTHTITYKCGSASGTICTKSSNTSVEWNTSNGNTLELARQNTTGTSVAVTFTITTYSGNTSLGSNTDSVTMYIPPDTVKPSVAIGVADAMGFANHFGGYVQGRSKIVVTHIASGSYGSTIETIKTNIAGKNYNGSPVTTDLLDKSGNVSITATVTDSRIRTETDSAKVTVLPYSVPKVSSVTAQRCDWTKPDGTVAQNGGLQVKYTASISPLDNQNPAEYYISYKKTTATEWEVEDFTIASGIYEQNGVYTFAADPTASYDIIITAEDYFDSVSRSATGQSVNKIFDILTQGVGGWAFGKIAELVGWLEVAYQTLFHENATFKNNKAVCGTDLDGTEYNALIPITDNGNTSLGHGLYKAGKGKTHIYGDRVFFYTNKGVYVGKINIDESNKELFENGNHLYFDNNHTIYGLKPSGKPCEAINFQNANGNTVLGWGNYDGEDGQTNIYGYDLNFGVANVGTERSDVEGKHGTTYRPYLRREDTVAIRFHGAGYTTNSKKEVHCMIPLSKPVVGTPTITVTPTSGFILRQEDKYTHGSGASTYAVPTKIEAYAYHAAGVRIIATFADTTNAINNAPVGVMFIGNIDFS